MKNLILLILLVFYACNDQKARAQEYKPQELTILNFEELKPYLNKNDDKTYIINFWATWCAPCVKELPFFEDITKTYNTNQVEVILVSLDFPKQFESKLKPFIVSKKIQSRVIALNDMDMNSWIPQVDESWSGAIPATIIYNKTKRKFYEKSFTERELRSELEQFLNLK